jgi:hypothetical protein
MEGLDTLRWDIFSRQKWDNFSRGKWDNFSRRKWDNFSRQKWDYFSRWTAQQAGRSDVRAWRWRNAPWWKGAGMSIVGEARECATVRRP